ncbi:MAG: hypothetical protein HOO96_12715 [Polyangiaceae bacterium]|nr:hypothetical protein [Polyangiaceae bacterium]
MRVLVGSMVATLAVVACAKDAPAPAVGSGPSEAATVASATPTATITPPTASASATAPAALPSTEADGPLPVDAADAADRCEKDADCIISDEDVCCPAPSGCMLKVRTAAGAKTWREERVRKFCPLAKVICKPAGSCQHPKGKLACKSHVCTFTRG